MYPGAGNNIVPIVTNHGLSRRDGFAARRKVDFARILGKLRKNRRRSGIIVPDLRGNLHLSAGYRIKLDQIEFLGRAGGLDEILLATDCNYIVDGVDVSDVHRVAHRQIQATTLTNGVVGVPFMLADDFSMFVHEISILHPILQSFYLVVEEAVIVVIGDETNFVGIGLVGDVQQSVILGKLAYFLLRVVAEREDGACQVLLFHTPQCVGLIFPMVAPFRDYVAPPLLAYVGVMAGGDEIAPKIVCATE